MATYRAKWEPPEYDSDVKIVGTEFFHPNIGYNRDDRFTIARLEIGQVWISPDTLHGGHTVERLA